MNTVPRHVQVYGTRYRIRGLLGSGEFCDVWWARREDPDELVVIKAARDQGPETLAALEQEVGVLKTLAGSRAQGSDFFTRMIPSVVFAPSEGNILLDRGETRHGVGYRWRSGFVHTYEDIAAAYPTGIDPRTATWMWKRQLDILGWLHANRRYHGNVTPQHILVHARDHGSVLAGWSRTGSLGEPLVARSPEYRLYYPDRAWEGGPFEAADDLTMSARCMFCILGGDLSSGTLPEAVPEQLSRLIYDHAEPGSPRRLGSAWDLLKAVDAAARAVYGPPSYHVFTMPTPKDP